MNIPVSTHPQVATWLDHIRSLAVKIGPRGSTTEGEREGAVYVESEFARIGLQPVRETFRSATSIFQPHLLAAILLLAAFAVYPLGGPLTAGLAAVLSVLVIVSEVQELGLRDNVLRLFISKAESQNVYSVIQPVGEHKQDLVLVGHIDTQRTPVIFRSPAWVKLYDRFTMVAFISFIAQAVLFSLGTIYSWTWVWYASIPAAICGILLAVICVEADSTPFTVGANDNASAVGMVLTLAEELAEQPLQNTRVFAVCTGSEEVQHYGMIDWYRRHRAELKDPKAIVFEMLGVAGPGWLMREGIIVPFKSDPELVKIAERLSAEHPEWDAYPASISGGNTEMADAARFKVPAITLFGLTREGVAPFWHQPQDTFDKMDPDVMKKTWELTRAMVREIDQG